MIVAGAKFDSVRLRRALRKQEQDSEQDGKRLDEGRTWHGRYLITFQKWIKRAESGITIMWGRHIFRRLF